MALKPNRGITWEPIAVPLAKGVDLRTRARLVDASQLLVAENVAFPNTAGVTKRFGHVGHTVKGRGAIPAQSTISPVPTGTGLAWSEAFEEKVLPANWLYGYGLFDPANPRDTDPNFFPGLGNVSSHPDAGILCGAATRDNEELLWDGFRLFASPTAGSSSAPFGQPAPSVVDAAQGINSAATLMCPIARTAPIAKGGTSQKFPSLADNGVVKVVAWMEGTSVFASVFDAQTDSPLRTRVNLATETGLSIAPVTVKCLPVGAYVHILVADSGNHKLFRITVNSADIKSVFTSADLGSCNGPFDVRKISDVAWAAVIQDTANNAVISYFLAAGPAANSPAPQRTVLVSSTHVDCVGFDINPVTQDIGLIWHDSTAAQFHAEIFSPSGVPSAGGELNLGAYGIGQEPRFTIAAVYMHAPTDAQGVVFVTYREDGGSVKARLIGSTGLVGSDVVRQNVILSSQAFRVGNQPAVFCSYGSNQQSTFLLMDSGLLPIGKLEYGTAFILTGTTGWLMPVNFKSPATNKDRLVFHTALQYNLRLQSQQPNGLQPGSVNYNAVFAETSIKTCYLDFLPRLRSAQAGRATYFAGAQLWQYDGRQCVEAGFHFGPELTIVLDSGTAGALVAASKYRYYIQLAYRNAQGEEIRGPGFLLPEYTVGGGKTSADLTLPTLPTRRSDSYYLIYRNENAGNLWYLVSSRDPASANCPKNNQAVNSTVFNDGVADATIISHELAPANPFGYLETYSSFACEVVASGKDRLWVAGGECPAGQVFPSRLFFPSQAPSFHPGLGILVDRGPDQITAVGFVEDAAVFFRRDHTYIQDGPGIDNVSTGGWNPTRLALSEVGAVSQEGLGLIPAGLVFQSPAGIRMMGAGGELTPIGLNVDPLARDAHITATVVIPDDQQIRHYTVNGDTLVYDYLQDCWSTWTGVRCWGAVKSPSQRRAYLARPDGAAWAETEGVYNDAGSAYRLLIRTAWLHGGSLGGFQRVRKIGVLGELPGAHFSLSVRYFYDERDFSEETRTWTTSNDLNTSLWGDTAWGNGVWGDTTTPGLVRDRVFRAIFRTARQKCSTISLEFEDNSVDGPGFVGTAVLLEVGVRSGLDRVPLRLSTQTTVVLGTGAKSSPGIPAIGNLFATVTCPTAGC